MSANLFNWSKPATIQPNNFKYKSLSNWSFNTAVGCAHACRFCYVPEVSTNKMGEKLATHGVADPDAQWGEYVGVRAWNEAAFLASLKRAEETPLADLKPDGNRAVMFCTTTDPYQVLGGVHGKQHAAMVRRALELILERSTLNVRILTRSPLARVDFDMMKRFGHRLLFGMSLPTLDDRLARIYEPHAPSPTRRLECLTAAKAAGLHVYVAVAPTYPECGPRDIDRTLEVVAGLKPVTVFMEPINIRAENVERIRAHAASIGEKVNMEPFESREKWLFYALGALHRSEISGRIHGLPMHLWPDASMGGKVSLDHLEHATGTKADVLKAWMEGHWNKISAWPQTH